MSELSIEERSWLLGRFYSKVTEYFAHWEDASFSREQLDDVYREHLKQAIAMQSRDGFTEVLMRFAGQLRNGHTLCYDMLGQGSQLGFQLERLEEGWVVIGSVVDEVTKGDVVESIDGCSPDEWMSKAEPFLTVPHRRTRETQWQHILPTFWNAHTANLRVRSKDDHLREFTYTPLRLNADDPRLDRYKRSQAHTEGRWLRQGSVGHIRIPSFDAPHYAEEALSYVEQFSSANTIIFDLRSNSGGNTPSSLTSAIMNRPYRWWTETSPNIGHLRRRHMDSKQFTIFPDGTGARCEGGWTEPSGCLFEGRIIALVDRYVGSAAEDFVMPLKDTGRGTLIGEHTWGSTGQPVFFDYQGLHFGVGSVRAYLPDGTQFEGIGIVPDISIGRTRGDLYAGRDPALAAALELC